MQIITYKEAHDIIMDAYFNEEILPYDNEFCICGNLAKDDKWMKWQSHLLHPKRYFYSTAEYLRIEEQLLTGIRDYLVLYGDIWNPTDAEGNVVYHVQELPNYEDALFYGVTRALAAIKKIHRYRGDKIDLNPEFKKRKIPTHV